MNYDNAYVYGGIYESADAARSDYDNLARLYDDEVIGAFQAAIVEKRPDGKVQVLDTASTTRATGAAVGAAIGAALGLIFPPAILLTAAGGAGVGAAAGDISKGWTMGDVKRLGEQLMPGQTGIVVIAEAGPTLKAAAVLAGAVATEAELVAAEDAATLREMLEKDRALAG
jgi:uncharacterized membrane protein